MPSFDQLPPQIQVMYENMVKPRLQEMTAEQLRDLHKWISGEIALIINDKEKQNERAVMLNEIDHVDDDD